MSNQTKSFASVKVHDKASNKWVQLCPNSIGDLKQSIQSSDHNGWLICDGRSLPRVGYPELFAVIGTSFGNIDENTFNLPDARGRVIGNTGTGAGLSVRSIGQIVGEETHTLTISEMPGHTHTGTTSAVGNHTHNYNDVYFAETGSNQIDGNNIFCAGTVGNNDNRFRFRASDGSWSYDPQNLATSSAGAHTHTLTTTSVGSGTSFNVMQPTIFIGNVFIYGKYF